MVGAKHCQAQHMMHAVAGDCECANKACVHTAAVADSPVLSPDDSCQKDQNQTQGTPSQSWQLHYSCPLSPSPTASEGQLGQPS